MIGSTATAPPSPLSRVALVNPWHGMATLMTTSLPKIMIAAVGNAMPAATGPIIELSS